VTPSAPEVLQGSLDHVVFANAESGWTVARLRIRGRREPVTVVGHLGGAQPGEELRVTGRWSVDPKYGEQFRAEGVTQLLPSTAAGIEKYLGSGLVRGVGPKTAARLVKRFGLRTLEVVERDPARLQEVEGIGPVRAGRIQAAWAEQKAIRDVMIFLQGHGISPAFAVRIYRRYGPASVATVRENPYRLAEEVRGIGFRTADRIAANLGLDPAAPARVRAALVYSLNRLADEGHVWAGRQALTGAAVAALASSAVTPERVAEELDGLVRDGKLAAEGARVALPALDAAERGVVSGLLRLLRTPMRPLAVDLEAALNWYQQACGVELAPLQRQAIAGSLREKVLIVTGGPGTGKTTLVRGIVEIQRRKGRRIELCAPTGRAAQRLAESTGQQARTIHRLLGFDPGRGAFQHDEQTPLATDLVIADEASMIDTVLMNSLLKAIPAPAQLLLVGDADQLPSVGPGNVLGDLLASGVIPALRLTEIFRQARASRIVVNAHRINAGQMPVLEGGQDDFFWIRREEPEAILAMVQRLLAEDIPRRFGLDPVRDVQVLTPMRRGLLGAANLNLALQQLLNPGGARGPRGLRVGDKVMQVENDYTRDVFNGDLGWITGLDEEHGGLSVRFADRDVAYDARDLDELALAYATSVHKAQGSEYPAVVVPLHTQHYALLQRRLLYTAVTRARRLVVLVGSRRALAIALRNRTAAPRGTALAERLRHAAAGARAGEPAPPHGATPRGSPAG
jgi:exodeoxyribonuclease V alpha subunit